MREIHLICNAHIDTMWLWEWEEGAAEAISTFRTAARLIEESDDFVFCHNEALLYEWILEYEPELFERIQKLVKIGKWKIMGGWYLQPDCNIPSGESFIREIERGSEFFYKYFNVKVDTAVNFDSFGHNRGLVQILNKFGYHNYMICRPTKGNVCNIPDEFNWIGYDGSSVYVRRHYELYNSALGHAKEKIEYNINDRKEDPLMILWGVGNHGGGPSRKDIDDINRYKEEVKNEMNIVHSDPDSYFDSLLDKKSKKIIKESLWSCNTGCYTSMSSIKQKFRKLEKELYNTEKISTVASLVTGLKYPTDELRQAERDLLINEFHDILPGTVIKKAMDAGLRMMDHGLEELSRIKTRAFFSLSNTIKYKANGNYPIFVWNPYDKEEYRIVEVEFQLKDQNWEDNFTFMNVIDEDGNIVPSQIEKEGSNLNLDWRKHVTFYAKLKPLTVNFFECVPYKVPSLKIYDEIKGIKRFDCKNMSVDFNFDTGLIDGVTKNGKEYLLPDSFKLTVFTDSEDPWAMNQDERLGTKIGEFSLASRERAKELSGVFECIPSSRIIEDGPVRTVIETVSTYNDSSAFTRYYLNKLVDRIDVEYKIVFNENSKCLKLELSDNVKSHIFGQEVFGMEELSKKGNEFVFHDYVGSFDENDGFYLISNGNYGGSYENDKLYVSLLRTPAYTGHPILGRTILKQDRYTDRIDKGYKEYKFSFNIGTINDAEKDANLNENDLFALSFFTNGGYKEKTSSDFYMDNKFIELVSLRRIEDEVVVRLYNGSNETQSGRFYIKPLNKTIDVTLKAYEFNTYNMGVER